MYLYLKEGKLKELILRAKIKEGTLRKLAEKMGISKSALSELYNEKRPVKEELLNKLLNHTKSIIEKEEIEKALPNNWKQVKAGLKGVIIRKNKGTFQKQLELCQKGSSNYMKRWHRNMKEKNSEEYYKLQHSRFKKVDKYKFTTTKGEIVRNKFEKQVADKLNALNVPYSYEPLVKIGKRSFFPDFLINNKIILECTMWRGTDKAIKLKYKIKKLEKKYNVYVVIPKALNNYYQILSKHLILGLDELVPVAQLGRAADC